MNSKKLTLFASLFAIIVLIVEFSACDRVSQIVQPTTPQMMKISEVVHILCTCIISYLEEDPVFIVGPLWPFLHTHTHTHTHTIYVPQQPMANTRTYIGLWPRD